MYSNDQKKPNRECERKREWNGYRTDMRTGTERIQNGNGKDTERIRNGYRMLRDQTKQNKTLRRIGECTVQSSLSIRPWKCHGKCPHYTKCSNNAAVFNKYFVPLHLQPSFLRTRGTVWADRAMWNRSWSFRVSSRAESSSFASIASSMALKCRMESFVPLPFPRRSQRLPVALCFAGLKAAMASSSRFFRVILHFHHKNLSLLFAFRHKAAVYPFREVANLYR